MSPAVWVRTILAHVGLIVRLPCGNMISLQEHLTTISRQSLVDPQSTRTPKPLRSMNAAFLHAQQLQRQEEHRRGPQAGKGGLRGFAGKGSTV